MKKLLTIAIVIAMLGSITLWAQRGEEKGRNYNRNSQWKSDTNENPNWAKCTGADSDGNISSFT